MRKSRRIWFLHLTDIHFGGPGHDRDWGAVNAHWQRDLKYFRSEVAEAPPAFVLFTGDLVYRGMHEEYACANGLFEAIDTVFDARVPVFAVPGNHDLARPQGAATESHRWLTRRDNRKRREQVFKRGSDEHKAVCTLFKNWQTVSKTQLEPRLRDVAGAKLYPGLLAGDQYFRASFGGIRIGLVGVNSTWRDLRGGAKGKGELTVDRRQLPARIELARLGDENDVTFLLQHQPPSWLDDPESWNRDLAAFVDVAWFGHMHRHKVTQTRARVQGASILGLEHYLGAKENRRIGYAWGRIEHANNLLHIRIWPRALTKGETVFRHCSRRYGEGEGVPLVDKVWSRSARDSVMDDLVRLTRERCRERGGQLHMCKYHHDRAAVRFEEQPADKAGEIQESLGMVTLEPRAGSFLFKMGPKLKLAGHFGLVACQREWLTENLLYALSATKGKKLAILQTGTAGPVHYLGTVQIIRNALRKMRRRAELITVERCCGPVLLVKALKGTVSGQAGATRIRIGNLHVCLDKSVVPLLSLCDELPELKQRLIVGSLTDSDTLHKMQVTFDVVISHFLVSFWKEKWKDLLGRFCEELWSVVAPRGLVLLAVGENRYCRDVQEVHDVFDDHGFNLESVTRTWDPYDFDSGTLARLTKRKPVTVPMNESLCRYVRR
jgi:predicted MPP superfamily phosphohydrolase